MINNHSKYYGTSSSQKELNPQVHIPLYNMIGQNNGDGLMQNVKWINPFIAIFYKRITKVEIMFTITNNRE